MCVHAAALVKQLARWVVGCSQRDRSPSAPTRLLVSEREAALPIADLADAVAAEPFGLSARAVLSSVMQGALSLSTLEKQFALAEEKVTALNIHLSRLAAALS